MKTLWCKNQENPCDRISHAWAPLKHFIRPNLDPLNWQYYKSMWRYVGKTDLKNMFWLEEELAGAPPQVEGGEDSCGSLLT